MSAPPGNILPPGTVELEFKGIHLHGYATDITDDIQWRIAVHEFDRRDGAQTENMGRGQAQHRVTLVFVGQDGFLDAQAFLLALEIDPSGLLIHPIHGKRQATCLGTQGARLVVSEANTYTLPVVFVENSLDASIIGEQAQGVTAKAQAVSAQAQAVTAAAAPYPSAASAISALTASASSFAAAAAATVGGPLDPSLLLTLNGLPGQTAAAIAALRAASGVPEVADAVRACEALLARAAELGDAMLAQRPNPGAWVVPEDTPIMVVLERFYGADAFARVGEFEANNPQTLGLVVIPAGTSLKLTPPTVTR